MRLTAVKLAGFKSFVDPTTFRAPTNLIGIVGPNGCGKSNIIDAVRWVMGEGSARVLRGELMSDVDLLRLMNTASRSVRPRWNWCSITLTARSADEYAELQRDISSSVRSRRDGIVHLLLNGTRCRRQATCKRPVPGYRCSGRASYSIIEQGMISRVVDAKP